MSERFRIQCSSMNDDSGDPLCHWFEDNGAEISDQTACNLLNQQAAQLEVLREWIVHGDVNPYREDKIIKNPSGWVPERVELAKRRIAALEGKSPEIPGISST